MPEALPLMLVLLVVLLVAKVFGELVERFGIPSLTGEVLAGLLLGPAVLGLVKDSDALRAITDLGVLLLIVMAGMEVDHKELRSSVHGRKIWIAIFGFVIPFLCGIGIGYMFRFDPFVNIFLGLSLAISALPVSIRILMDLGKLHSDVGRHIITAAIFNDIVALLLLGVILELNKQEWLNHEFFHAVSFNLGKVILFMVIYLVTYRLIRIMRARTNVFIPRMGRFIEFLKGKESLFALFMIFVLAFAGLAELLGLHFIIGAFFGSILFPRESIPHEDFQQVKRTTSGITMGFLAPIFFAYLGILIDLRSFSDIILMIVILVIAFISKLFSGYFGGRIAGLTRPDSLALGIGMNTKGIMELVIANIAFQKGFIDTSMFTILVILAIVTTVITPFLLKRSFMISDPKV